MNFETLNVDYKTSKRCIFYQNDDQLIDDIPNREKQNIEKKKY